MFRTSFIAPSLARSATTLLRAKLTTGSTYKHILSEVKDKVGLITLNRPKALNALCDELLEEIIHAGKGFDKDPNIGAIVLTGS
jgi:1,4-dihydroxy-2-naphthoyl-CoA synthase